MKRLPYSATPKERFAAKVRLDPLTGCWMWTGAINSDGYGSFFVNDRVINAHRFAFQAYRGAIPNGMELDHLCRIPACVNPDHLEAVSHRVNMLRGTNPLAVNAAKTHCSRGHPFSGANVGRVRGDTRRVCKACDVIRQREQRLKEKERSE